MENDVFNAFCVLDFPNEGIKEYNAYDNDTHKQMLLYGLNQIKKNKNLADYNTVNFSASKEEFFNGIDEMISYVDKKWCTICGRLNIR